ELVREFKRRHYADWVDVALPALDGRTPRQAVATKPGREAVDRLLKEMQYTERRMTSADEAFDFGPIRRELGLD
ncbi:MAG TPA: hypothetical protein VJP77_07915, partial [Planctomycetota bacterium]|nr:hypothetical protein [Planctomycetota bacterium]